MRPHGIFRRPSWVPWIPPRKHVLSVPPPLNITNIFNGGTDGTALSTANTGGASGTAFDAVSIGSGNTLEFDNVHSHGTGLSSKHDTTSGAGNFALYEWNTAMGTRSIHYGRVYYWSDVTAQATHNFVTLNDVGGTLIGRITLQSNGLFRFSNEAGTTVDTSTTTIATGQWVRFEWMWDLTAGSVEVRLYNTAESLTADDTLTGSVTAGSKVGQVEVGLRTIGVGPIWTDDVALSSVDWIGPSDITSYNTYVKIGGVVTAYPVYTKIAGVVVEKPVTVGS